MYGKLRYKPKTFMRVRDSKGPFSSSNCSNNGEVKICHAAQTLFSVQPISRVLEVQMHWFLFCWKAGQFPKTSMWTICLNSDVSNDVFCRQEDKDCYVVKRWSPTQQLVIKSTVLNFTLWNEAFAIHLGILIFKSRSFPYLLSFFVVLMF
jgi:hypothetical protein